MASKQTKFVTPEEAAGAVRSGDWVDYGFGAGFPELVDRALAARKGQVCLLYTSTIKTRLNAGYMRRKLNYENQDVYKRQGQAHR